MVRIGDLLPDAARGLGLEDELRLSRAMATFERSSASASRRPPAPCRVVRVDGATLVVEADAPIVAQELRLRVAGARSRRFAAARPAPASARSGSASDADPRPADGTGRGDAIARRRVYCADLPANLGACVPRSIGTARGDPRRPPIPGARRPRET